MSNKGMIINECERMNAARRVFEGRVDSASFFRNIHGDLLISGVEAGNQAMVLDLFCCCLEKNDMPTILLTSHPGLMTAIQRKVSAHEIDCVMTSYPADKNYHPFYGMSAQQILRFVRMTAEEMGYGILTDQVMIYAAAVLKVVAAKYPVSLPAIVKLLEEDDDFISEFALQSGFSNVIADNIRANHEAGIILRRLFERMEEIFEKHHVCLMPDTALTKVGSHAFIVKKSDGNLETLEFEYGFVCLGMRSASPVLRELQEKFPPEEVEIVNIGDSIRARRIIDDVSEGRNIINVLKKREYIPR